MRISPINIQHFKGSETHIFGYDDEISKTRREYIREHIESNQAPKTIYGGRLEEYELQQLINGLLGKNTKNFKRVHHTDVNSLNHNLIDTVPAYNLDRVGKMNSYRGSSLYFEPDYIPVVKQAGIKTIVDLEGFDTLKDECIKNGLDYLNFSKYNPVWNSDAFLSPENVVKKERHLRHDIQGCAKYDTEMFVDEKLKSWHQSCREFIDDFVKLIKTLQDDNFYIGCDFGTIRTDTTLMLNHFFNPRAREITPTYIIPTNHYKIYMMENLYNNLTEYDKQQMGWTEEFDKNFLPYLHKVMKENGIKNPSIC